jgi:hypothetical protein
VGADKGIDRGPPTPPKKGTPGEWVRGKKITRGGRKEKRKHEIGNNDKPTHHLFLKFFMFLLHFFGVSYKGSKKTPQKPAKGLQKNSQKYRRTKKNPMFLSSFYQVFVAFLGMGSKKTPGKIGARQLDIDPPRGPPAGHVFSPSYVLSTQVIVASYSNIHSKTHSIKLTSQVHAAA